VGFRDTDQPMVDDGAVPQPAFTACIVKWLQRVSPNRHGGKLILHHVGLIFSNFAGRFPLLLV